MTSRPRNAPLISYHFMEPVTEVVKAGTTETWRWVNLTVDAHPMHMHLVTFQVVNQAADRRHRATPTRGSPTSNPRGSHRSSPSCYRPIPGRRNPP